MAFKKSHVFPKEDQILCYFFRALSHAARIDILRQLSHTPEATVDALTRQKRLSRPTYSEHLQILRKSHLISCREKFPHTHYKLDTETRNTMKKMINEFLDSI